MRNHLTRLLVGSLFLLSSTTAHARPARKHAPKLAAVKPTVSMQDARKTAIERIPGTIKSEELEKEHGRVDLLVHHQADRRQAWTGQRGQRRRDVGQGRGRRNRAGLTRR